MLKSLVISLIFLLKICSFASDDYFDSLIEDLIYEKLIDKSLIIEVSYEPKDKIERIKDKSENISDVSLIKFDPTHLSFKAKLSYKDGSADEIFGRYETFVEAPVVSRFIKAGEIISSSDVVTIKTKAARIRDRYVSSSSELVGMLAKKNLTAGVLVKSIDLVRPPVIKQNDPINIVYNSDHIRLKTSGMALGSGAVGDMIKIKNEDTGMVLLGQIISKNTVQVGNYD